MNTYVISMALLITNTLAFREKLKSIFSISRFVGDVDCLSDQCPYLIILFDCLFDMAANSHSLYASWQKSYHIRNRVISEIITLLTGCWRREAIRFEAV